MYCGPLYRLALEYAKATCDDYRILSAKHGLLEPDTITEPYELFPDSQRRNDSAYKSFISSNQIFKEMLITQLAELGIRHRLIYLCNSYFARLGPSGEWPIKGMDIFRQRQFYRLQREARQHERR